MRAEAEYLLSAVAIGGGATLVLDLWNQGLKRALGIRSLDMCLLGRWIRHMPRAFRHAGIAAAAPRTGECAAGWAAHYAIGIVLALAFLSIVPAGWLARPTLVPALLYGLATVVFPLFVLQPALGFGVASARTPRPLQARVKSAGTHVVYGLGLYLVALALTRLADYFGWCSNARW